LQEEAKYPFAAAHRKVHVLFAQRVAEYQDRFSKGENVTKALNSLLVTWLLNHIKRDDADYSEDVKAYLKTQSDYVTKKKGFFSRLFS